MIGMIKSVSNYVSLVKFSHTIFAMPFALIGFALAVSEPEHQFSIRLFILILLCMIFARNTAMAFNRLTDRKFDAINPRTSNREIPSGRIKPEAVVIFIVINAALFIITTGFINRLTLFLSPLALLIILGYSLSKRITFLCHFILGLGLSLAPIGAYISVTAAFSITPIIYSFIVLTWVSGFDIIYALQDDDFDRRNHLYSLPSSLGRRKALALSVIIHFFTFVLVMASGFSGEGGLLYWAGAVIFTALLIYQHLIVKHDDLSRVGLAFGTTNGIASMFYAIFAILDLYMKNR